MIKSYKLLLERLQKDGFHIHTFFCDRGFVVELVNHRDTDRFVNSISKGSFYALLRRKLIQRHEYKEGFYILAQKEEQPQQSTSADS